MSRIDELRATRPNIAFYVLSWNLIAAMAKAVTIHDGVEITAFGRGATVDEAVNNAVVALDARLLAYKRGE